MAENKQLLNKFRGTGAGSRVSVDIFKLEDHGWTIEKYSKGFKWTSPDGKKFCSSSQVQQHLKQLGTFDKFKGETYSTILAPEPPARISVLYLHNCRFYYRCHFILWSFVHAGVKQYK